MLIGQDEPLRVHEKSRAVPRFAPYCDHGVLQPLEVLGEVIGGGLCRGCGSSSLLHFGVVIGQVNVLLTARKRNLNVPRKALASQLSGLGRRDRAPPRRKLCFRGSLQAGLQLRGLSPAFERYQEEW